jgi:hypothetical protein
VPASYSQRVLADAPIAYWPLDADNGFAELVGAQNGTAQGGLALPSAAGPLVNESSLAPDLDGSNDYISTAWTTRRNLCTNPVAGAGATTGWNGASYATFAAEAALPTLAGLPEGVTTGFHGVGDANGDDAIFSFAVASGSTYRVSAYIRLESRTATGMQMRLVNGTGTVTPVPSQLITAVGGDFVRVDLGNVAATLTGNVTLRFTQQGAGGVDFHYTAVLIEQASALGTYFDGSLTSTQPDVAWEGTAHASVSGKGPFVNGSVRTFEGWAWRDADTTQVLVGTTASGAGGSGLSTAIIYTTAGNNVLLQVGGSDEDIEQWAAAWPGQSQWVHWAITFNDLTNAAELFINGVSKGVVTHTADVDVGVGEFKIGAHSTAASSPFDGRLAHVAVYNYALPAVVIESHYRAATLLINRQRIVREPSWLGLTVEAPDGPVRCSPKEGDPLDVLTDSTIRTDLHGHAPCDLSLARPEGDDGFYAGDRIRRWQYAPYRVFDEADRTVSEGRIVKPRAGASEITLETEGWSKATEDDESASLIGVDRDLAPWREPGRARRISILSAWDQFTDPASEVDTTTGQPSLRLNVDGALSDSQFGISEAWYDLGRDGLGDLYYAWEGSANAPNTVLTLEVITSDDDSTSTETSGDRYASGTTGEEYLSSIITPTARRFVAFSLRNKAVSAYTGERAVQLSQVSVWADHGLTKRGTAPDQGLYVSDIAPYIVGRWCPLLNINTRSIEQTSFVLPHWVQREATTVAAMLDSLTLFGGNTFLPLDWYVFDNRELEMKSPDNHGRVWRTRLSEGVEVDDAGDDATTRISGVKVSYTNGSGSEHTIGPPGSGSDTETTDLLDTNPANPVNYAKGVSGKIRNVQMGITFEAGATLMGQVVLADANRQKWSGDVKLKGHVREHGSGGAEEPVYMVRTFDRGIVEDDPDVSERRITATSYTTRDRTNTVTIGTPPERFPTLAARAGVVLEGVL